MLTWMGNPSLRYRLARAVCTPVQPFGAGLLQRKLYPREVGRRDDLGFVVRAKTGSLFAGRTSDHHGWGFSVQGFGEWRLWAVALATCRAGDTIVEVGANVGTETVGYSDIVGAAGRVIAFEPAQPNLRELQRGLALLTHDNVEVRPYALGATAGTVEFAEPPKDGSSGIGHVLGPDERRSGEVIYRDAPVAAPVLEVEMRTLDSEIDGNVRLIAMDAEGSEAAVLQGSTRVIERSAPVIVLEANPWHQRRAGVSFEALHSTLRDLDYVISEVTHLGLRVLAVAPPATSEIQTWLALPESQVHHAANVARMLRRCALTPCVRNWNPLTAVSQAHQRSRG